MALFEALRRYLHADPAVSLAVAFGSVAKGDQGPDSDIDLGIRFDSDDRVERIEIELGRSTRRRVDVVLLDEAPPLLRFEIAKDGIVLVEREKHAWADFRARAMLDWWDWAPVARTIEDGLIAGLGER